MKKFLVCLGMISLSSELMARDAFVVFTPAIERQTTSYDLKTREATQDSESNSLGSSMEGYAILIESRVSKRVSLGLDAGYVEGGKGNGSSDEIKEWRLRPYVGFRLLRYAGVNFTGKAGVGLHSLTSIVSPEQYRESEAKTSVVSTMIGASLSYNITPMISVTGDVLMSNMANLSFDHELRSSDRSIAERTDYNVRYENMERRSFRIGVGVLL